MRVRWLAGGSACPTWACKSLLFRGAGASACQPRFQWSQSGSLQSGSDGNIFQESSQHRLAAFHRCGDNHSVRFDSAEFARLKIGDDHHFAADQLFGRVCLGDAGDQSARVAARRCPLLDAAACRRPSRVRPRPPCRRATPLSRNLRWRFWSPWMPWAWAPGRLCGSEQRALPGFFGRFPAPASFQSPAPHPTVGKTPAYLAGLLTTRELAPVQTPQSVFCRWAESSPVAPKYFARTRASPDKSIRK